MGSGAVNTQPHRPWGPWMAKQGYRVVGAHDGFSPGDRAGAAVSTVIQSAGCRNWWTCAREAEPAQVAPCTDGDLSNTCAHLHEQGYNNVLNKKKRGMPNSYNVSNSSMPSSLHTQHIGHYYGRQKSEAKLQGPVTHAYKQPGCAHSNKTQTQGKRCKVNPGLAAPRASIRQRQPSGKDHTFPAQALLSGMSPQSRTPVARSGKGSVQMAGDPRSSFQ